MPAGLNTRSLQTLIIHTIIKEGLAVLNVMLSAHLRSTRSTSHLRVGKTRFSKVSTKKHRCKHFALI
jgi:hypothetical protein